MKHKKKICDKCKKEKYIWKNDKGNRYCKYCWSGIKQAVTKPSRKVYKPIPYRSIKRKELDKLYAIMRKKYLLNNLLCAAQLQRVCTKHSTDVHHMAGRIGDNYLDTKTWLPVCRSCHMWIEEHPKESKEMGFTQSKFK